MPHDQAGDQAFPSHERGQCLPHRTEVRAPIHHHRTRRAAATGQVHTTTVWSRDSSAAVAAQTSLLPPSPWISRMPGPFPVFAICRGAACRQVTARHSTRQRRIMTTSWMAGVSPMTIAMLRTFWKEDPGQLAIDFCSAPGCRKGRGGCRGRRSWAEDGGYWQID